MIEIVLVIASELIGMGMDRFISIRVYTFIGCFERFVSVHTYIMVDSSLLML